MADPYAMFGPSLLAAGIAFAMIIVLLALAVYVYSAVALMFIAKRAKTKNGWLAFIPIANIYLITQVGKQSGWWTPGVLAHSCPQ